MGGPSVNANAVAVVWHHVRHVLIQTMCVESTKRCLVQSKSARGERMVFSVDAQRELWSKAASTAAGGFPGGPDAYVQVRDRTSRVAQRQPRPSCSIPRPSWRSNRLHAALQSHVQAWVLPAGQAVATGLTLC